MTLPVTSTPQSRPHPRGTNKRFRGTPPALRVTEYYARSYRRTWRGSIISTFLSPLLYLTAMGVGLGTFVDGGGHAGSALGHISYLNFVAPALIATTAMQTAAGESTFPVMDAIKWHRTYLGMLTTPIGVTDVLLGHVIWITVRLVTSVAVYLAVMAAFGAAHSMETIAALPAGVLTGLAFACPIMAFAATQDNDAIFNVVFRFGIIPLFLFSGTFFPVSQLPSGLRDLAFATPLWHGVALCRSLTLGTAAPGASLVHGAYLVAVVVAGFALARITYRRRLRR